MSLHFNKHKLDKEATKARHFSSGYSYVSFRVHPGTDHGCQYLCGMEDMGKVRTDVFDRDGHKCVDCGTRGEYANPLHLAHKGNTKISRCDCMENLSCKCYRCHSENDHHGRF